MSGLTLASLLALASADAAYATDVPVRFCVTYNLAYTDAGMGDTMTGSTAVGRGILVRFIRSNGSYFGKYMDWNGSDPGCREFDLDDSETYEVKVVYQASVNGNMLYVNNDSGDVMTTSKLTGYTPLANDDTELVVGTNARTHVMAAAGWAMAQHNLGVTGEDFAFALSECPGSNGSSCDAWVDEGTLYINNDTADHQLYKRIVVHELGHAMVDAANGAVEVSSDSNAPLNGCSSAYNRSGHRINSKEWQATAINEGLAQFYGAMSFNTNTGAGADCEFQTHYTPDWNLDGVRDADDPEVFSCEVGVVLPNDPDIDAADFLGDHCLAVGATNNRATEYDWLRHLWDLHTDYGYSGAEIVDIVVAASPDTWNTSGVGTGADYPATRMFDAANTVGGLGLQLDYAASAGYNGVDR